MPNPHPNADAARVERRQQADALGIDAAFIDRLVERFYRTVRFDPVLAPIFATRIDDWPPHLARMKQFWAAILRGEGGFSGNPMLKHLAIPGLGAHEFARWLALFADALACEASSAAAAHVYARAEAIAASLRNGIERHCAVNANRQPDLEGADNV